MTTVATLLLLTLGIAPQDIAAGPLALTYTVRATTAEDDGGAIPLDVEVRVDHPPRPRALFQLPVWTPGSYRLRPFPERISDVRATTAEGGELPVLQLNANTWQVRHENEPSLRFAYRVRLEENDRFMMRGDSRRCLTYEGPAVYMYLRGHKDVPCAVTFDLPDGWEVGSGLVARENGFFAQDYDFLADCPVKIGRFQRFGFTSHGVPIDVIVDGPGDLQFDAEPWVANIKKVCDVEGAMFGGLPFDRYAFLFTAGPRGGGGGLEHLTSTAIGVSAGALARSAEAGLGTVAHEFFHTWNVKRLRPRALGPFDYTRPVRTTMLWLMEGVTSYYTDVMLARCGLRSEEQFWSAMQRQIQRLESTPARAHVSSSMASFTVWDPNPADRSLDYYNSGEVLGLLLDLEIRARTQNRRSLDDLMRALWRFCADSGRGFDDAELVGLAGTVAGGDLSEWFDRYVDGTVSPPYAEMLGHAGVRYEEERSAQKTLRGLTRMGRDGALLWIDPDADGRALARRSGRVLSVADRALDGENGVENGVEEVVAELEPGPVRLELETLGGGRATVDVQVETVERVRVRLSLDPDASELARAIRSGITSGQPGHPAR